MIKEIDHFLLTVKYWLCGDDWEFARQYAHTIVYGFRKNKKR